jgi:hypothetical protein
MPHTSAFNQNAVRWISCSAQQFSPIVRGARNGYRVGFDKWKNLPTLQSLLREGVQCAEAQTGLFRA